MRATTLVAVTILALLATAKAFATEPLTQASLNQIGLHTEKPAPYQMLTIKVANFQVELCGIPATETEPIKLVRKELCLK
jgi:hypothetical protein